MQLMDIKQMIFQNTYDIIRAYYQKAYQLGNEYVNSVFGTYDYITHNDLDFIEQQTNDFVNRFFGRMENLLIKSNESFMLALFDVKNVIVKDFAQETQIDYFSKQIEKSSSYLFSSLAILIITDGLNQATVRKTRAMLKLKPKNLFTAAEFNEDLMQGLESFNSPVQALKYVWKTTQDERTCDNCFSYSDMEFDVDDPSIPTIPDDTHFNCRCRIVLQV